jgi:hypothetical protein
MKRDAVIVGWTGVKPCIRGSKQYACSECAATVWLAPSGQNVVASGGARLLCAACVEPIMANGFDLGIAPGAKEEYVQSLLDDSKN